jgi:hypothetical protein
VPFELIDPILSSRQIRLLGGDPNISAGVRLLASQLCGQLVDSFLVANSFLELIFDKTWCYLDHTMVLVA